MSDNRVVPETDADWAHWEAESEYDWLSERCPFCPCLSDIWGHEDSSGLRERNLVFHCQRSGFQNEVDVGSLCLFCQHLDPGQLFGHFRHDHIVQYESVNILLGTFAEVEARRQCAFCQIIMCTIRAHAAVYRTKQKPISRDHPITIAFERHQQSSINLSFDEGPWTYMAVKKVSLTHSDSSPEVDQVVGASISWKQVRRWIDLCCTQHRECLSTVSAPSGMRLIDVRDRKITPELSPRDHHAYTALSYVWGKKIDSRRCVLLKENTAQLEQTKSLKDLPRTIEDAMTICKNLGQRFLWVDRLCIVQDDEAKKGHQIHAMANIFQSAVLTIVATCGDSMESPIPGISTERQIFQSQTRISCLQLTSALPRLSRTLPEAPWSQRGWTYQESILSSRKLYFTDLEVWFACNDGFEREDISLQGGNQKLVWPDDIPMTQLRRSGSALKDYWIHLEEYTKRSLTYQSDVYNAFTGILTALFGEDKTVYGLPELYLDNALLWRIAGNTCTSGTRDSTVAKQHLLCPSWAWSSIDGAVKSGEDIASGDYMVSLVLWSLVDGDGDVRTIDVKLQKFDPFHHESLRSLVFAWRGGCFDVPLPSDLQEKLELDQDSLYHWAHYDLPRRWLTVKEFRDEVRLRGNPDPQIPLATFSHLRPGMLLTRTQTAVFRLGACQKSSFFEYFEVVNENGNMVGAVEANELRLKSKAEGEQRLKTGICELMALSLSRVPVDFRSYGDSDDIRDFLDQKGDVVLRNVAVKVLLISWNKNTPIGRRVSIGWVYLKTWVDSERTWKTVVLE